MLLQQKLLDAALVGIFFCANFQSLFMRLRRIGEPPARVSLPFRVEDHAPCAVRAAVAGQTAAAVFALRAEVRRIQPLRRDLAVLVLQIKPHRPAAERNARFERHFALHALVRHEVPAAVLDEIRARLDEAERHVMRAALAGQRAHPVEIARARAVVVLAAADHLFYLPRLQIGFHRHRSDQRRAH